MTGSNGHNSGNARASVVMLAGECEATDIVYNALSQEFAVAAVIVEQRVARSKFLKSRFRRLGATEVLGQIVFQAAVAPALRVLARDRSAQIKRENALRTDPIDPKVVHRVSSANADETLALLRSFDPAVVVVSGTRILSKRLLTSVGSTFINMHAGITPVYRGVHGGYWALAENRPGQCGVTVHLVDPGVDTGGILGQALIHPSARDNFATYPVLQLAAGIPLLLTAVRDALAGKLTTIQGPDGESRQWYHPTAWGYIGRLLATGVK